MYYQMTWYFYIFTIQLFMRRIYLENHVYIHIYMCVWLHRCPNFNVGLIETIVVLGARIGNYIPSLTLSQCTLAGPVYTGMPLECHWMTQCTLGHHWATQRILAGYTGTPLEKLSWNSPTLECHWRNLVESGPHWDAPGETLIFAAYTGTPLEELWQPTHAPTHVVKHAE